MPKRSSKPSSDPNVAAYNAVRRLTDGPEALDPTEDDLRREVARLLGRRGGLKGGKVRAERLTPARRSEIARRAAAARWKGHSA